MNHPSRFATHPIKIASPGRWRRWEGQAEREVGGFIAIRADFPVWKRKKTLWEVVRELQDDGERVQEESEQ